MIVMIIMIIIIVTKTMSIINRNNFRDLACSFMITTDNDEDDNKCDTNQEVMVKRAAGT